MFGRRKKNAAVPEVGKEAPKFQLPSAQGGQLQMNMRTVRGPVVVAFYRPWSEEDVEYFKSLAEKEDEINMAGGSVVGIGVAEDKVAREFARASGMKSYVLYDYAKVASREWGLLERDKEHGDYARPAVFVVGTDQEVVHAWTGDRPLAEELLAKVSEITGLPRPAEEEPRPKKPEPGKSDASPGTAKKLSKEEREKIKAERRAAREAGKSLKSGDASGDDAEKGGEKAAEQGDGDASGDEKPKKMTAEERERIKAERRAAREAGKSLKKSQDSEGGTEPAKDEPAGETEAAPEQDQSAKAGEEPQAEETRAEAEVDAGSREGDGDEEQADPLPEEAEAGERQEKKRAEEG